MKKGIMRRTLAAIVALAVSVPYAVTVSAANNNAGAGFRNDYSSENNAENILDLLTYLKDLGSDFGLPPIMISEGDKVYIDGKEAATTVVPLNRDLVNKQNKVRSEYWLDTLKAGDYEALEAADAELKAYFEREMSGYNAIDADIQDTLVQIRDYCIANGITYTALMSRITQIDGVLQKVTGVTASFGEAEVGYKETDLAYSGSSDNYTPTVEKYTGFTPAEIYIPVDENGDLSGRTPADDAAVRREAYTKYNSYAAQHIAYAGGMYDLTLALEQQLSNISEELSALAGGLDTLIGDTSVSSREYITEKLKTTDSEDMLYAYASLYANLYRVNRLMCPELYELYIVADEQTNSAKLVNYKDYGNSVLEMYHEPTWSGTPYIVSEAKLVTKKFIDAASEIADILNVEVTSAYDSDGSKLDGLYNLIKNDYTFNNLGTAEVTYTAAGNVKTKADKALAIIDGIPDELRTAWELLYDSRLGVDAVDTPFAIETFEDSCEAKKRIIDGQWDYCSTIYDAEKYYDVKTEVNGSYVTVKKPMTDAEGNPKYYGRQNEVTPWISIDALKAGDGSDSAYLDSAA